MKPIFYFFSKKFLAPLFSLFIKKIEGKENLDLSPPFIVASNHISGYDHFFLGTVLKKHLKNLHFVGARESFKIKILFGLLYWLAETIVINRKNLNKEDFFKKLKDYLNKGKIIVIYPEGDTNPKEVLLRGKTGIAQIALMTGVSILPIGMKKIKKSFKRIIKIGKPMNFKKETELSKKNFILREITDKIMREIAHLSEKKYPY